MELRSAMSVLRMSILRMSLLRSLLKAFTCCLAAPVLAETVDVYDNHGRPTSAHGSTPMAA
jgi:hypothetical protein